MNFDDNRLYGFDPNDFARLDDIINETGKKVLFFDELQEVTGWERYVRQKLDEDYKIVVTGSNASLLSKELGTKLTGRYLSLEIFPFSFSEFTRYNSLNSDSDAFIPRFSYSLKAQLINPRKVYSIDPGMISVNSTPFS